MPKIEPPAEVTARCRISGAAHDYMFEGELVQTVDGRVLRRCRAEVTKDPPLDEVEFEPIGDSLNLHTELARLRSTPPLMRPNHRIAQLELRAGAEVLWLVFPRPLIGDSMTDHPADRLYAALWGWPSAKRPPARRRR